MTSILSNFDFVVKIVLHYKITIYCVFSNLVNGFSLLLATLYNNLAVVAKSATSNRYYYDAHQTEQVKVLSKYDDPYTGMDQNHSISTNIADDFISVDKLVGDNNVDDDDFCAVVPSSGNPSAAATAAIPSVVDNVFPSSASSLAHCAYNAASVVVENTTRTAIRGAVRSYNFVWIGKKHIDESFVQQKTKKYTPSKMRGFDVDFDNVPGIKFKLARASSTTTAASSIAPVPVFAPAFTLSASLSLLAVSLPPVNYHSH